MKTVIVGVDFTVVSDNAVKYAVAMANNLGCSLVLINVFQIPITFSEVPVVNPTLEELHDISKSKLENLKDNILHTDSNLKIFIESRLGSVSEEIFALSQKLNPIAIVVGSHSKTGMEEFFLGSNTMEIIKTSTYPVIIIPKGAVFHDVKRIGIATDLKNVVEETPSVMIKRLL
jgi:nucleotide-binding universal stress UspA family protein